VTLRSILTFGRKHEYGDYKRGCDEHFNEKTLKCRVSSADDTFEALTFRTHLSGSRAEAQFATDAQRSRRQTIQNCTSEEKDMENSVEGLLQLPHSFLTYAATIPPTSCATAVIQKRAGVIAPIRHNAKLTLGLKID
jgi:hypothetical protein